MSFEMFVNRLRNKPVTLYSAFAFCLFLSVLLSVGIKVLNEQTTQSVERKTRICMTTDGDVECTVTVTALLEQFCAESYNEVLKRNVGQDDMKSGIKASIANEPVKSDMLSTIPSTKPMGKVVGKAVKLPSDAEKKIKPGYSMEHMTVVKCWHHESSLSFMRFGVRYQNGRLIVPLTGTYIIYSFLSLTDGNDVPDGSDDSSTTRMVKHAVYKYNVKISHDIELASSIQIRTYSTTIKNAYVFSSHIDTLVQLVAGDEISVKISGGLLFCNENNFFGLRLV
ncbi:uncharacterized protein LOC127834930 [Dreissena polymorpha]|uniref:THD domain-containing protein n=1 Tax=Dreissena polymorpha TaxID=45954 RepID=A0A9D4GFH0_DREPO|nr:uncharacterized protein LOC127834930 [Dreissena polymorpha]KAH3814526.1 hypothetical protein DPMN_143028 [Dreissena polymorpha]